LAREEVMIASFFNTGKPRKLFRKHFASPNGPSKSIPCQDTGRAEPHCTGNTPDGALITANACYAMHILAAEGFFIIPNTIFQQ